MGEVVLQVARWTAKLAFWLSVVGSVLIIFGVIFNYMIVGFNMSVLGDIFAMIQIWLPFNLNILLGWLTLAATGYIAYRFAILAYNMIDSFLGRN